MGSISVLAVSSCPSVECFETVTTGILAVAPGVVIAARAKIIDLSLGSNNTMWVNFRFDLD